jgi:5-methylcytosine-specific restriction protein B
MNENIIQQSLQTILESYAQARANQTFAGHSLRGVFESLKGAISSLPSISTYPKLRVKWSMGQGNWAKVPWIALLDGRETDTTQRGVYCVYLFRQDMSGVYLTFNQGVTQLLESKGKVGAYAALRARAHELRAMCAPLLERGFKMDEGIDLKAEPGLGADYEPSTIAHKFYELGNLPDDLNLVADLDAIISVYENYLIGASDQPFVKHEAAGELSALVASFIVAANSPETALHIADTLAIRFVSAILSKRFGILTGLAGSGKTKLAQAFAEWLTPKRAAITDPSPYVALIPVGADWTGNDNLVGYPNGLDSLSYNSKPALELILHAEKDSEVPHFLILDEMNLSHVERYFADILSAMESEAAIPLHQDEKRISNGQEVPKAIKLPPNLFIIGTVNVDETTYMFSPKVLDRANVIEFRMEAVEIGTFLDKPKAVNLWELNGKGINFGPSFVEAAADKSRAVPEVVKGKFKEEMLLFFKLLQAHHAEFGYRTSYEAGRFIHFYKELGGYADKDESGNLIAEEVWSVWFNKAMDAMVVQKLLPKLHGSRTKLEGLLWALGYACGADRGTLKPDEFLKACQEAGEAQNEGKHSPDAVEKALNGVEARYPLSFDKILRMYRKLVRDQFVTFAEA